MCVCGKGEPSVAGGVVWVQGVERWRARPDCFFVKRQDGKHKPLGGGFADLFYPVVSDRGGG